MHKRVKDAQDSNFNFQQTEAVVQGCSVKTMFLKI